MTDLNLLNELDKYEKKPAKRGWKFWLAFWSVAVMILLGWFVFLEYKKSGWIGLVNTLAPFLNIVPIEKQYKSELKSVFKIAALLTEKEEPQTFLILFQNNNEIRPGGGFIGSFGVLKLQKGEVKEIQVHDTNIFDDRIASGIIPPYPMPETLRIKDWEMRDSNWSPDFKTNAHKAIELYAIQGGEEKFDGVIAISTGLLSSFLEFTGPISIEGFPGEYNSENAITKLQYQVERGYREQDIEKGKRKYIMKDLAREILKKAQRLSLSEKKDLLLRLEQHMNQKDVMMYFHDSKIQKEIAKLNWNGEVIVNNPSDYLMMIDANLAAYKTDRLIIRSFKYKVDFSLEKPSSKLEITYQNTARAKDWMTNDYQSYLRVYTPAESWLTNSNNHHPMKFGDEFNKKYFGTLIQIPINNTRTYLFEYSLPEKITYDDYNLIIQKQSGIKEIKGEIEIINNKGESHKENVVIKQDWKLK